ncbi:MAG TPA: PEGA domain-containing protein [Polyangia bacterium]
MGGPQTAAAGQTADADAETHLKKGLELRRKGKDTDALAEFEEAMRISPSPRARAQVGLAQMAIGLFEAAETNLSQVLASTKDDPWVNSHRPALKDALAKIQSHLGTLNASGEPQGATVEVNGTAVGKLPCSVRVQAGDAVVKVLAPGFIPITRTVSVEARATYNQVFTLVSSTRERTVDTTPTARPVDRTPGATATPTAPVTSPPPASTPPPTDSPAASQASPWPWIVAGGGVLALAFGGYEAVRWSSKASSFNSLKGPDGAALCNTNEPGSGGAACATLLDEGHTARALAITGLAVGAALAVTSIILFVNDSSADQRQAFSCAPALGVTGNAGVVCAARF